MRLCYTQGKGANLLEKLKIIQKVAIFFAVASIVFVVLSAVSTYFLLKIASPTAPTDYVAYLILSNILPYLFIAVLALIIAVVCRGIGKEESDVEPPKTEAKPEEEIKF